MVSIQLIAFVKLTTDLLPWSNPNQSNKRSAVYSDTSSYGEFCLVVKLANMYASSNHKGKCA